VKSDYELVSSLIGIEKAFDPNTMFTNEFLDKKVHMTAK
jgi:NitT/TauT family transport system substrate-binding protein